MSDTIRKRVEFWATLIGLCCGLSGMFGAFVILPYKVDALEKRETASEAMSKTDHELILRIDERLAAIQKTLERERK